MSNFIYDLKQENILINTDLEKAKNTLHETKVKKELDKKTFDQTNGALKNAQINQKYYIKKEEKDKKRFKVLQKYGQVLHLVEKLLGLIPTDLNNLSTEELEEKLKELINNRKKNENQMMFVFYQNLISDLLTNLITIETKFSNKEISSKQALEFVQVSKQQIKEYAKDAPESLKPTIKNASDLVKLYENNYNATNNENFGMNYPNLISTEVNSNHRETLENLNNRSTELISKLGGLSTDISNYQAQVDLNPILANLEKTEYVLRNDKWTASEMTSAVRDLEKTTIHLTDQQVDLNKQNDKIEHNIKDITEKTSDLSSSSLTDVSKASAVDIATRTAQTVTNQTMLEEKLQQNDDSLFWLAMIPLFMGVIDCQMVADETLNAGIAPNCDPTLIANNGALISQIYASTQNLTASVDTILKQQGAMKTFEFTDKKG